MNIDDLDVADVGAVPPEHDMPLLIDAAAVEAVPLPLSFSSRLPGGTRRSESREPSAVEAREALRRLGLSGGPSHMSSGEPMSSREIIRPVPWSVHARRRVSTGSDQGHLGDRRRSIRR